MSGDPKSWRELRTLLTRLGGCPRRVRGSHEIWGFEGGERFVVLLGHLGEEVPTYALVQFRRLRDRLVGQEV